MNRLSECLCMVVMLLIVSPLCAEGPSFYSLPGFSPTGVSGHGEYVLGSRSVWSMATGVVALDWLDPDAQSVSGAGISDDGSVIAGYGYKYNPGSWVALRWSGGPAANIGTLPGGDPTYDFAYGISGNGQYIVGRADTDPVYATYAMRAFRWSAAEGMVDLGTLGGNYPYSMAYGASYDGNVVVGITSAPDGSRAFRWTPGTGMVGLADLPGGDINSKGL